MARHSKRDDETNEPKKDYEKAAGKAHWIGGSKPTPLTSSKGWQLFLLALPVALIVLAIVQALFGK